MNSILRSVLSEELERVSKNRQVYKKKLEAFPYGALVTKNRGSHFVNYLVYRKGAKVKTDYVRKGDLERIKMLISKRENIAEQIKVLEEQKKDLEKSLKESNMKVAKR